MIPKLIKVISFGNCYLDLQYENGEKRVYIDTQIINNPSSNEFKLFNDVDFSNIIIENNAIRWKNGYQISNDDLYVKSLQFNLNNVASDIAQYNYKILKTEMFDNYFMQVLFENGEYRLINLSNILSKMEDYKNFKINVTSIIFENGISITNDFIYNNSYCVRNTTASQLIELPKISIGYWFDDISCIVKFENGEIKLFNPTKWLRGLKDYNHLLNNIDEIHKLEISKNGIGINNNIIIGYEDIYNYGIELKI